MASQPYIGEIAVYGMNFAPNGWASCDGSLLPISQHDALFSLFGTTYGGNGTTTFALPDLRSRLSLGTGAGPGLSSRSLGQSGGSETVTLTAQQIPPHRHPAGATNAEPSTSRAAGAVPARGGAYAPSDGTVLAAGASAPAGGSQPHENVSPFQVLNLCVALYGVYPSAT